jgi:hypothetical protein
MHKANIWSVGFVLATTLQIHKNINPSRQHLASFDIFWLAK